MLNIYNNLSLSKLNKIYPVEEPKKQVPEVFTIIFFVFKLRILKSAVFNMLIYSWFDCNFVAVFTIYSRVSRFICGACDLFVGFAFYSLFFRGLHVSYNIVWNTINKNLIWNWNWVHFDYLYTTKCLQGG
jgi:hypothetical protein